MSFIRKNLVLITVVALFTQIGFAMNGELEKATLGGGCFWCTEAVFQQLEGVKSVLPGYSGGFVENPSYQEVCTGSTGHAEVVQITFDPSVITFADLLEVFFSIHDPTTLNRQGADVGTQYRSVIFCHSEMQKKISGEMIGKLHSEKLFHKPVVTEVVPFTAFYQAEKYHMDYYRRNSGQPYCRMVIAPKLQKFREKFSRDLH